METFNILKMICGFIAASIFARLWLVQPWPHWVKVTWEIIGGAFDLAAVVLLMLYMEGRV